MRNLQCQAFTAVQCRSALRQGCYNLEERKGFSTQSTSKTKYQRIYLSFADFFKKESQGAPLKLLTDCTFTLEQIQNFDANVQFSSPNLFSSIPESRQMIIKDSDFQHKNRQDNPRFSRTAPQSWKIQKKLSLGQGSFLQVFFSQEPALQCNKKNSKYILLYKKMSWYVSAVPGHDLIFCLMFAFHLDTGHFYHPSPA